MQPKFVFVWMEQRLDGRPAVASKPTLDRFRQCFDFARHTATEPQRGQPETQGLDLTQRAVVQAAPTPPEFFVVRIGFQKPSQFVGMAQPDVAAQQMPQQVHARIGQRVGRIERDEMQIVQRTLYAALPKLFQAVKWQPLRRWVPEAVV